MPSIRWGGGGGALCVRGLAAAVRMCRKSERELVWLGGEDVRDDVVSHGEGRGRGKGKKKKAGGASGRGLQRHGVVHPGTQSVRWSLVRYEASAATCPVFPVPVLSSYRWRDLPLCWRRFSLQTTSALCGDTIYPQEATRHNSSSKQHSNPAEDPNVIFRDIT